MSRSGRRWFLLELMPCHDCVIEVEEETPEKAKKKKKKHRESGGGDADTTMETSMDVTLDNSTAGKNHKSA